MFGSSLSCYLVETLLQNTHSNNHFHLSLLQICPSLHLQARHSNSASRTIYSDAGLYCYLRMSSIGIYNTNSWALACLSRIHSETLSVACCHGKEGQFFFFLNGKDGIVLWCLILCSLTHHHVLSVQINIPVTCSGTDCVTMGYFRWVRGAAFTSKSQQGSE